jgi:hypothetical protein
VPGPLGPLAGEQAAGGRTGRGALLVASLAAAAALAGRQVARAGGRAERERLVGVAPGGDLGGGHADGERRPGRAPGGGHVRERRGDGPGQPVLDLVEVVEQRAAGVAAVDVLVGAVGVRRGEAAAAQGGEAGPVGGAAGPGRLGQPGVQVGLAQLGGGTGGLGLGCGR